MEKGEATTSCPEVTKGKGMTSSWEGKNSHKNDENVAIPDCTHGDGKEKDRTLTRPVSRHISKEDPDWENRRPR